MTDRAPSYPECEVLILAPMGNDARNAATVLDKAQIRSRICFSISDLCQKANDETGALLIGEETLDAETVPVLVSFLETQQPWSDLPLMLVTSHGASGLKSSAILNYLGNRANVTLLEKPLRALTLISILNTALRSRYHQYEVRGLLQSYVKATASSQLATAKFRAVFEQSAVFAGVMALDGTLLEANRLSLEFCGFKGEEEIGRLFWECGWWKDLPEEQDKIRAGTAQCAAGTPYVETLSYKWADGTRRIVELGIYPIRDDAGQVKFLHPTGVDITKRIAAQSSADFLSQLTQKLSIVSDPAEINRVATREIGQFLAADRCWFFQAMPSVLEVRVLPDWRPADLPTIEGILQPTAGKNLWQKIQQGPISIDDVSADPLAGENRERFKLLDAMAFISAPFIHEGHWVACISASSRKPRVWTDDEKALLENAVARVWPLYERAQVALRLRDANGLLADKAAHLETLVQQRTAKLSETIEELEAFSYSIAHDMRAPLRSLEGFSEILLTEYAGQIEEDGRQLLKRIAKAASRMDRLIQDILNYSRVVRAEFPMSEVKVGELLRDLIDTYPILSPERADIILQEPLPTVFGNEAMLTQIFSNLLGNAVKFTPAGLRPQIRIWAEPKDEQVRLVVQDNGIGIAPDQFEKIFGIFQQINKSFEGTGIGLAIVKKAAARMGGKVGVKSEPGQGSTFWIDLPLAGQTKNDKALQ